MLKLINIKKDYIMKDSKVSALKGLSINFRKNEFVSILGPSGCGKTTLLNILGGLDKYSDGDLVIDGKSTKDFNDHDWDIYRNHRIGFIFQSYNLIPHENILENVELALTIAGVSKQERIAKAKKALDEVGLKDMYKKMPNQLSGGQCQRVAIARALVNEPEILLADEPTGALDSITSVQIMELIKKISKDRLVIMVTHNPELAYKYSTRIVKLLDGNLLDDSNPFSTIDEENEKHNKKINLTNEEKVALGESASFIANVNQPQVSDYKNSDDEKVKKETKEKAKMSWFTAFTLSAKNLFSKFKRTVMIVIAASIGIVGVSAVLSIRGGVTDYIVSMQDEMLSGNPIEVSKSAFDLSSITSQMTNSSQNEVVKNSVEDGKININFLTKSLIESAKSMGTTMIENDITQEYVDYVNAMPSEYYQDIVFDYGIDINNNIYTYDDINGNENKNYSLKGIEDTAIAILEKKLAENGYSSYASMISSYSGTFAQSLNNPDYMLSQYDIVSGKIATEANEVMIVLDSNQEITDFMLTLLGYFSQDEFLNIVYKYNTDDDGNPDSKYDDDLYNKTTSITYEKLMSKKFVYYPNDTIFAPNYTDSEQTTINSAMPFSYSHKKNTNWTNGYELSVVGILKPKEGRQYSSLSSGFYYTPKFSNKFISDNYDSKIATYVRDNDGYTSSIITTSNPATGSPMTMYSGIYYKFNYEIDGEAMEKYALLGSSNSLSSLLSSMMGGNGIGATTATLYSNDVGGNKLPNSIAFYPNNFNDKNLVTDYLDKWNNSNEELTFTSQGKEVTIKYADREDIKYTDNLAVVISMINNIINIISIALIAFTALSLVVSTVMIAIITYVSVIERIKEIGVIRALGGRKKDVSHLFNAETFIIGLSSGVFGILITYIIQTILNLVIHNIYPVITTIAALPISNAVIIILVSILLTVIAGFIPARSAAQKDPVIALRTE